MDARGRRINTARILGNIVPVIGLLIAGGDGSVDAERQALVAYIGKFPPEASPAAKASSALSSSNTVPAPI